MAGEISANMYNPMMYNQLFGMQSSMNDDFMSLACQPDTTKVAQQPVFKGNSNLAGQPPADTYQKSGSLVPTVGLGILGGVSTGAGMYYYGGEKFGITPIKDGKLTDEFLKTLEDKDAITKNIEKAQMDARAELLKNKKILSVEQYNAIKEMAKTGKATPGVKIPKKYSTKDSAAEFVKDMDKRLAKINNKQIEAIYRRTETLEGSLEYLKKLNDRKAKLGALPETISEADLAKHLEQNAKFYGIEGKDATATAKRAKNLAKCGLDKLKASYDTRVTNQNGNVKRLRDTLKNKVEKCLNDAKTGFKDGTPENWTKAFKNYKLSKAGKWGIGAGIVAGLLGYIFSSNKS